MLNRSTLVAMFVTEHYPATVRRTAIVEQDATAATMVEQDATAAVPNAMALRRAAAIPAGPSTDSSVQTAFQMSLTVLSFLAFGGYVITMVAQNMRKPPRNDSGMTAPLPLKAVVVNRNRRPSAPRPTGALATVSFGRRRKRSRRFSLRNPRIPFLSPPSVLDSRFPS